MDEVFTTVDLPVAGKCKIIEGKGKHYFNALMLAKGDSSLLVKYLIIELCKVNGKNLTEEIIDEMHLRDISYMTEVIASMMSNDFINGI